MAPCASEARAASGGGQELVFGDDRVMDIDDPRFSAADPPLFQVQLTAHRRNAMKLIDDAACQ
jgi:hypothetical protein